MFENFEWICKSVALAYKKYFKVQSKVTICTRSNSNKSTESYFEAKLSIQCDVITDNVVSLFM